MKKNLLPILAFVGVVIAFIAGFIYLANFA
jgi:hypothetical protein